MDNSPFSKLSAELMNNIFEMVIADHKLSVELKNNIFEMATADRKHAVAMGREAYKQIVPPIVQVCKELRDNYLLMSFDNVAFTHLVVIEDMPNNLTAVYDTSSVDRFCTWLELIDDKCHRAVRKIRIRLLVTDFMFSGGERFESDMARAWERLAKMLAKRGYGDGRVAIYPTQRYWSGIEFERLTSMLAEDLEGAELHHGVNRDKILRLRKLSPYERFCQQWDRRGL